MFFLTLFSKLFVFRVGQINNNQSINAYFFTNINKIIISNQESIDSKIINIEVEEKPTGEIQAGAGAGTEGGTFFFGVKENNYIENNMVMAWFIGFLTMVTIVHIWARRRTGDCRLGDDW